MRENDMSSALRVLRNSDKIAFVFLVRLSSMRWYAWSGMATKLVMWLEGGGWLDGGRGGMMRGGDYTKKPKRSEQRYINEELHVFSFALACASIVLSANQKHFPDMIGKADVHISDVAGCMNSRRQRRTGNEHERVGRMP